MKEGSNVKLASFLGMKKPPADVEDNENYWKLIGEIGRVIQHPKEKGLYASFSKEKRLFVKFLNDVKELGLECHNSVENSLWILESDLIVLD